MKFLVEQIAIAPRDPDRARNLLIDMGLSSWVTDRVVAEGFVFGVAASNVADLAFNYDADGDSKLELEVLSYREGNNWLSSDRYRQNSVSHLGMHVTEGKLNEWKAFFSARGIEIAQEVNTLGHTNKYLQDNGRTYHYCVFDTKQILGVDIKFIVRKEKGAKVE